MYSKASFSDMTKQMRERLVLLQELGQMGGSAWYALLVHALHPLPDHCFNGARSMTGKF